MVIGCAVVSVYDGEPGGCKMVCRITHRATSVVTMPPYHMQNVFQALLPKAIRQKLGLKGWVQNYCTVLSCNCCYCNWKTFPLVQKYVGMNGALYIMAYGSTPYAQMALKKIKWWLHWKCTNGTLKMSVLDYSKASMSKGLLTLLESITKAPDWQVTKTGKLIIFELLSYFCLPSTRIA